MPIEPAKALAATFQSATMEYTQRDVILYALGVGAGVPPTDEVQLKFTFENGLEVLPTYGVVPAFPALFGIVGTPGLDFNPMMLLHGEQYLEIRKHPIPVDGKLTTTPKISAIYDKGKGALVILDATTVDEKGDPVFFNQFSIFLRGEGGFGGESGPAPGNDAPARAPDKVVEMPTLPQQALLYRLSGDLNPLHASPQMAMLGGFEKPILHGLCTFGFAGRAILESYCGNDPRRFKSIKVRFAKHVFPGETIVTKMWKEGKKVLFEVGVKERPEQPVITNAAIELND